MVLFIIMVVMVVVSAEKPIIDTKRSRKACLVGVY